MTIQEKILRIKSRCTELLALAEKRTPGAAEAGWRTTIAAIDRVLSGYAHWQLGRADQITLEEIATAWPDELL